MPYPKFTKVIIHHFISQHKSISKRQGSRYNTVDNDGVLDRLKFIGKGEEHQKGRGKGAQGTKATVIPKKATVAFKKNQRKKESNDDKYDEQEGRLIKRKPKGVVIQDTPRKAIKASKRESRFQHQSGGSSKRAGITPDFPDEPTGKSTVSDEGADEKAKDISWVSTDEDEYDDNDEADDESIDIEKIVDDKTDTDQAPFHDVKVSIIPKPTQIPPSTPPTPPLPATVIPSSLAPNSEAFNDVVQRVFELEKDIKELKQVDHSTALFESIKFETHTKELHQQVPQDDVSKFIKVKQELVVKEKMPKYSTTPYDQAADDEHKQKDILFRMMMASKSHEKHLAHKVLYDALIQSLLMDENDMDRLSMDPAS
nr:hypothetical protein [Tanacetum cinerariifolium]